MPKAHHTPHLCVFCALLRITLSSSYHVNRQLFNTFHPHVDVEQFSCHTLLLFLFLDI